MVLFCCLFSVAGAPLMAVAASKYMPSQAVVDTDVLEKTYTHMMTNWLRNNGTLVPMEEHNALRYSLQALMAKHNTTEMEWTAKLNAAEEASKAKVEALEADVAYFKNLSSHFENQSKTIEEHVTNYSKLSDLHANLDQEFEVLATNYTILKGNYSELDKTYATLKEEYEKLLNQKQYLETSLADITGKLDACTSDCCDKETCDSYAKKIKQLQDFIKEHENILKKMGSELKERNDALVAQAQNVTQTGIMIDDLLSTFQATTPRTVKRDMVDKEKYSGITDSLPP